ncbi:unnamed protein product [Absidia cylindrospora]
MLSQQPASRSHEAMSPLSSDKEDDYALMHSTTSPMIPLTDLCTHFPDLPSFVHHPDFDHFAYCWMEFQYHMAMSQHAACRPGVKVWLVSMSAQLLNLAARYPSSPSHVVKQEDHEASTFHIKSAYQRMVHRFGALHKLLEVIDHRNTVANQSPQEIVLPIYNILLKHKLNQQIHHTPTPSPSPPPQHESFSITSSSQSSSSSSGMSTPITSLSLLSLSSPEPATTATTITTTSFRSASCMEVMPYLNDSCASSPHIHPMSLVLPPPSQFVHTPLGAATGYRPSSWSTPVTPYATDHTPAAMFWSCPTSPSYHHHRRPSLPDPSSLSLSSTSSSCTLKSIEQEEDDEAITPLLPVDYHHPTPPPPPPPIPNDEATQEDETSSEYREDEDDEDNDNDDDQDEDYCPPSSISTNNITVSPRSNKDDPSEVNKAPPPSKRIRRRRRRAFPSKKGHAMPILAFDSNTSTAKFGRRGRTATSYDQDTTHFLKSMFFNVYSRRDKLTKDQRRQVVERTGLKPRNVTYWFSNHKRRFQTELDVFRKLIVESNGRIQTYDDDVAWRREQGLPDDMGGDNDI